MRLKAGAARISVCHVFLFRFMGIALLVCARSQAPRAAWGKKWGFPVWIVKGERAEPRHTSQDPTARYIHAGLWAVHAHTVL